MSASRSRGHFTMPSTSGRSTCLFELDHEATTTLRLRYTWSVYGRDSVEPKEQQVVVPPMWVRRDRLLGLVEQVRVYADALGREPPSTWATELAADPGHSVRLELLPGDPSLITSPWQAVFAVLVTTGPSFTFEARYAVDATCLDQFCDGIHACRDMDEQHMAKDPANEYPPDHE